MIALYMTFFLVGLIFGVRSMLTGVEKPPRGGAVLVAAEGAPPRVRIRTPTVGAFATVFGAIGYFLERSESFGSPRVTLLVALVGGVVAVVAALLVLGLWAKPALAGNVEDPRYVLQGFPARVTSPITAGSAGEVTYEVDGRVIVTPALGFEGGVHAIGEDVVIDRVEDGMAYVEAWSLVQERI